MDRVSGITVVVPNKESFASDGPPGVRIHLWEHPASQGATQTLSALPFAHPYMPQGREEALG